MRRDGQRSRGHVGGNGFTLLGRDALGLHVGDDPVQEVGEDGCGGAWSIGVDHDEGVFGCCSREGEFGSYVEGGLGEGFWDGRLGLYC